MDTINLNDLFLDDNYTIESLLARSEQKRLDLSELRARLLEHQQSLNQTSLELFDTSYDRFYKLSYIISCLAEPVQRLIDPLQAFRNQLAELCRKHDDYLNDINRKLASLEDTARNKDLAIRLIALIKRRDRIERQLENVDWGLRAAQRKESNDRTSDIDYTIKCDLLERLNVELYHLTVEVKAIKPTQVELIPIKKSLEAQLDTRQLQLDRWFEGAFLEALESEDHLLINLIIRTYKQRDALPKLNIVWQKKVVLPYMRLTVLDGNFSISELKQKYKLLHQFIDCQLKLVDAEFVVRSFWSEVVESMSKLEKLYSLEPLESFQERYAETEAFLELQNKHIISDAVKIGLSLKTVITNTRKIMSRFDLKGYFDYRLIQIASSVESCLSNQPLCEINSTPNVEVSSPANFKLRVCKHIYSSITECWSSEMCLGALELSFSQLACRVINRFADWLSKLRLSDFRITGPTTLDSNRQTNFLAKQDAIMRLLLEDCDRLTKMVEEFVDNLNTGTKFLVIRRELIADSITRLTEGLSNVRSLQRLIER